MVGIRDESALFPTEFLFLSPWPVSKESQKPGQAVAKLTEPWYDTEY